MQTVMQKASFSDNCLLCFSKIMNLPISKGKLSETEDCFQTIRLRSLLKSIGIYYKYYYKTYAYNLAFLTYPKITREQKNRNKKEQRGQLTGETTVITEKSNAIKKPHL